VDDVAVKGQASGPESHHQFEGAWHSERTEAIAKRQRVLFVGIQFRAVDEDLVRGADHNVLHPDACHDGNLPAAFRALSGEEMQRIARLVRMTALGADGVALRSIADEGNELGLIYFTPLLLRLLRDSFR
jgi:hypothetical protein